MSRIQHMIVGWGLVLGAIGIASISFPSIAQKAAEQRDQAIWQSRAEAFTAIDQEMSEEPQLSAFAMRLAEIYSNGRLQNTEIRDLKTLADLQSLTRKDMLRAKHKAREHQCLSEAVFYEARSEQISGQTAVAQVVMNRVSSKHFPNSICGVVYQGAERRTGCQFSFTCDGSTALQPKGRHWDRAQKVARTVMTGATQPIIGRSTHYHTVNIDPHWSSSLQITNTVGSHKFYSFKWRERPASSAVSVAPPTP